jgi:hypothetical protein
VNPQGWYKDPFGVHDARWFTEGRPTALVRDGSEVLQGRPPPNGDYDGPLEPYVPSVIREPALPSDPERWIAENFPERLHRPFLWEFILGRAPDYFSPWRKIDKT